MAVEPDQALAYRAIAYGRAVFPSRTEDYLRSASLRICDSHPRRHVSLLVRSLILVRRAPDERVPLQAVGSFEAESLRAAFQIGPCTRTAYHQRAVAGSAFGLSS